MASPARYCPFCGARLRDDVEPLAEQLRNREECREAFREWDPDPITREATSESDLEARRMRSFLKWVVIAVVLTYAFLIAMDPILGVVAAGIVYLAFRWGAE